MAERIEVLFMVGTLGTYGTCIGAPIPHKERKRRESVAAFTKLLWHLVGYSNFNRYRPNDKKQFSDCLLSTGK